MRHLALLLFCVSAFAQDSKSDAWSKSKECAERADKVMTTYVPISESERVTWSNHYSPKYDRCFVEVRHFVRIFAANPKRTGIIYTGEVNWISTELQDAFERSRIASFVDPKSKQLCTLQGDTEDCAKVRGFIADRMTN